MVDSKNVVVCDVLTPDHGVAEYIVERCNDYRYTTVSNRRQWPYDGSHSEADLRYYENVKADAVKRGEWI